jgi:hypothetical protein
VIFVDLLPSYLTVPTNKEALLFAPWQKSNITEAFSQDIDHIL